MPHRRQWRLSELVPRWLPEETIRTPVYGTRFQMGVSFRCPTEQLPEHRHELWFKYPLDGMEPKTGVPLYELGYPDMVEELLASVTVLNDKDDAAPIAFSRDCKGWLVEGLLVLASVH